MSEEQFVFKSNYLVQSCDQSQYETYEKMILKNIDLFDKVVGDIQLMLAEKKRVDPAVLNTKLATVLDRITELEEMQNKLLKQHYREAHSTIRSDFWDAVEDQLQNWCNSVKDFSIHYETKKLFSKWIRVAEYLSLQNDKQFFIDDFNKKIHDYEKLLQDDSKFEWLLEKLRESEKLIQSVKDICDKQMVYMFSSQEGKFEAEKTKTVEYMQNSINSIRDAIKKRQEELKRIQRSPLRTTKISHPSSIRRSVTGGSNKIASVATSRSSKRQESDKLELENLKARKEDEQRLREQEMQLENEREEMEMRKRERELENERKKAEAKEELRELEMAQKRGSSRASGSVADDIASLGSSKNHEFVDDWTRNLPKQRTPPPQPHTPEVIIDHPQTKTKEGAEDKRLTAFFTFPPTFAPVDQSLPLSNHNLRETVGRKDKPRSTAVTDQSKQFTKTMHEP